MTPLEIKCLDTKRPDPFLDMDITACLGGSTTYTRPFTSSADASINVIRRLFPAPEWVFGVHGPDWKGEYLAFLNNRQPSHLGFDNLPNSKFRSFTRTGKTLEGTLAAVLLAAVLRRNKDLGESHEMAAM